MRANFGDPHFLPLDDAPEEWDEVTLPVRFRESHEAPPEVWTRYSVRQGKVRFTTWAPGRRSAILPAGQSVMLPPRVKYAFSPVGPVRLTVQRFKSETELHGKYVVACPVCRGLLETGTNHDGCRDSPDFPGTPQRRFYGRPRPDESDGHFAERFKEGVSGMIAEYRREEPHWVGQAEPHMAIPHEHEPRRDWHRLRQDQQASMELEAEGTA